MPLQHFFFFILKWGVLYCIIQKVADSVQITSLAFACDYNTPAHLDTFGALPTDQYEVYHKIPITTFGTINAKPYCVAWHVPKVHYVKLCPYSGLVGLHQVYVYRNYISWLFWLPLYF